MSKLKSRKFWTAIASAALVVANQGLDLGLPEDAIMAVVGIAITYILAQGGVDAIKAKNS